jgi:hypothetical protein
LGNIEQRGNPLGVDGVSMTRREDQSWKAIGAFVVVCGLLTALIVVLL